MNTANKEIFRYSLGAMVVLSVVVLIGLLIFKGVPDINAEIIYMAVGQLIGMSLMVVNYFYGSSKGSSDKTELMNKSNAGDTNKQS